MINFRKLQEQKKWRYHFDELSQEIQRKILDKYFKGEFNLYKSEKAREYYYTEKGKLIKKED